MGNNFSAIHRHAEENLLQAYVGAALCVGFDMGNDKFVQRLIDRCRLQAGNVLQRPRTHILRVGTAAGSRCFAAKSDRQSIFAPGYFHPGRIARNGLQRWQRLAL